MRERKDAPKVNVPPEGALADMFESHDEFKRVEQSIKPNYGEIRELFVKICLVGAVIVLLFQIALFLIFKFHLLPLEFKTSEFVHLLKYLIIPSIINFGAVLMAWRGGKHDFQNDFIQNAIPILAMDILCAVTASAHSVYSITLMLPCLPVFMASIFARANMVLFTAGVSAVGLIPAIICRSISPYWTDKVDTKFVPEVIAAYALVAISTMVSLVMIKLLNAQKDRLIMATQRAQIARQQAQEANQAKSDFLANMSHEIRTPLNAVIGLTEMVSRRSTEPEVQEYAGDIQQASNALLAIINDILDISKIESGKIEIRESNYELGSLINDSYNMVAMRWKEKGLTATIICDPQLPRMLCGDEYHLRQVIVNLLSNAVKYTEEGGIVMRVAGEEDGGILRMEVSVKDSGIGIREEDFDTLFDKFSRLEYAKSGKIEGTGLGLAITKQLVELMHGTIQVESVYGVGSTFTVRIPQKIADATPIGDIHKTYLDVHGDVEQYQQSFEAPDARILVVDDIPINLQVIKRLLEATRIQVDTASSGAECLQKVQDQRYDLILMDHMMPVMDGVETLEAMHRLRESRNDGVPVIMLTANAMFGAREEYLKVGFVDYISKPVRGARLERMILRYLPAEKVTRYEKAAKAEGEKAGFSLDQLYSVLPEIDIVSGLAYCADDEQFYRSMLKEFSESGRDAELDSFFAAEDWENYRICAHTLKSSAKMVGFPALSEEGFLLEKAAQSGDLPCIRENHARVLVHYRAIMEALRSQKL